MDTASRIATVALVVAVVGAGCGPVPAPSVGAPPAGDDQSRQLRIALVAHEGIDYWAPVIEDITMDDGIAQVTTTTLPAHAGEVDGLCMLLADVLYDGSDIRGVGGFVIRAVDGSVLIRREAADQPC